MFQSRRIMLVLIVFTAAMVGVSSTYVAQQEYSLSVTPSVEVPDRTTEFNGKEYTVTAIGRVQLGSSITVDAEGPSNTTYDVIVYNNDNQREQFREITGDGTVSFDTANLIQGTGSYMIVSEFDGEFQAIHPVVVPAYGVSQTSPSSVNSSEAVHVRANLTEYEDSDSIESVEAVIANDGTERRVDMNKVEDLRYEANISTDSLSTGDYQVYVVVRGTETFENRSEIIGLSDPQDLTIESDSTTTQSSISSTITQSSTPSESGGQSTGSQSKSGPPTPTTQSTQTSSATTSSQPTNTITQPRTTATTVVSTEPSVSAGSPTTASTTPQTTSDRVITRNTSRSQTTDRNSTGTATGTSLGAFPIFWIALCLILLSIKK